MRELTKSMLGFSWAMSLFPLRQMWNLTVPQDMSRPFARATDEMNAVARAAGDQLGSTLKGAYEAGDRMQRSMVDMMFGFFSAEALNPNYWMRMGSDVMQGSVQAMSEVVPGGRQAARAVGSVTQAASAAAQSAAGWVPGTSSTGGGAAPPPGRSL